MSDEAPEELRNRKTDGQNLRSLVYHTDARVMAVEHQMSAFGSNLQRQEQKIDQLISQIGRPKEVNWSGWAAFALAVMIGLFAANNSITGDTTLRLAPVTSDVQLNFRLTEEVDSRLRDWESRASASIAKQELVIEASREHSEKIDSLNARMAASEKDRENMHDRIESLDEHGSRRWVGVGKPK